MTIDVAAARRALDGAAPEAVLAWAFAQFPRLAISTAFGPEGCALVAMAVAQKPDVKVFTVDTDFLFPESIALRDQFAAKYHLDIEVVRGQVTLAEQNARHGLDLWQRDTDQCCALRKVEPTERALHGLDAWVAGLRRDQSKTRADIDVVELYERPEGPLYKVNPLLHWTRSDTWKYLHDHEVPYNPLLDQGYKSIGCWPCTKAVGAGDDERAGRWGGQKSECGIHTFMAKKG
ncbi:MAG: phosphoadenosine phosphosulfate reductase [Myxococcales bacterium]|nr:phosphoadenosine phosphosulfate reductase [Myxococcales bacterium]